MVSKRNMGIIVLVVLVLLIFPLTRTSNADVAVISSTYCSNMLSQNVLNVSGQGLTSLVLIAVTIMMVMLAAMGIVYMLGHSFGIGSMQAFAKNEIAQVFVTMLIVAIFLGSFALLNVASTTQSSGSGSVVNQGTYLYDCNYLYQESIGTLGNLAILSVDQTFTGMIAKIQVSLERTYFGVEFSPLTGTQILSTMIGKIDTIADAVLSLLLGGTFLLSFIYSIFPLFLYVGIVLRTLPWTRVAGGSFIALFIGFYVFFPVLLHFLLAVNPLPSQIAQGCTASAALGSSIGSFQGCQSTTLGDYFSYIKNNIPTLMNLLFSCTLGGSLGITNASQCLFVTINNNVLEPMAYTMIAIVLSIILTFNFTEAIAKTLGSGVKVGDVMKRFL